MRMVSLASTMIVPGTAGAEGRRAGACSLLRAAASALALVLMLTGCREVRVQTIKRGLTSAPGGNQVVIVRTHRELEELGIRAPEVQFIHEFGVALLWALIAKPAGAKSSNRSGLMRIASASSPTGGRPPMEANRRQRSTAPTHFGLCPTPFTDKGRRCKSSHRRASCSRKLR